MSLAHLFWASLLGISFTAFSANVAYAGSHSSDKNSEEETSSFKTPIEYQNVPQLFREALNYESGNFFDNHSLEGRLKPIFGVGESLDRSSFPENEIIRDSRLLNILHRDYRKQQVGEIPIRTRDLENPYTTSVGSQNNHQQF
ncbi:hypothetical protein FRE64_03160 [Euhalothece natronophila Z-M001]|uniref:Uncharacterized protein n=1 Tax=Euhalothece natronophila Z-M001 TaxID=522448 RepID=A0A5B8NIK9_9CHRO|nr:hypothetical protein [Euhalothece natronophila]QDZ39022.1 hypothetical protein FRE64_03160 [Euhalothece natronophila Z-M001]